MPLVQQPVHTYSIVARLFADAPEWAELLRRLPKANLLTEELADAILNAVGAGETVSRE